MAMSWVQKWLSSGILHHVVWWILSRVSEHITASTTATINLMMEGKSASETSVILYVPDYTTLHPRREPHLFIVVLSVSISKF
jgi:hypothetical protein